jgi:uncharacterized membrane protein YhaH (DUF805 family)
MTRLERWQPRLERGARAIRSLHNTFAYVWLWTLTLIVGMVMALLFNEWAVRGWISDGEAESLALSVEVMGGIGTVGMLLFVMWLALFMAATAVESYRERDAE